MIAVDTNILVYAHRADSPWYPTASERIRELAERRDAWAIPWPCVYEFLSVVTHPRIFRPATPIGAALRQVAKWLKSPSLVLLGESAGYWPQFSSIASEAMIAGPAMHDARIAAICVHHGVRELWTADRDFGRFPALTTRNPLVA